MHTSNELGFWHHLLKTKLTYQWHGNENASFVPTCQHLLQNAFSIIICQGLPENGWLTWGKLGWSFSASLRVDIPKKKPHVSESWDKNHDSTPHQHSSKTVRKIACKAASKFSTLGSLLFGLISAACVTWQLSNQTSRNLNQKHLGYRLDLRPPRIPVTFFIMTFLLGSTKQP